MSCMTYVYEQVKLQVPAVDYYHSSIETVRDESYDVRKVSVIDITKS